jgi:hypothetical protein
MSAIDKRLIVLACAGLLTACGGGDGGGGGLRVRSGGASGFDGAKSDVSSEVRKWDGGAGFALRVQDKTANKTATYVFATKSPPEWRERAKGWITIAKAVVGRTPVATAVVNVPELKPGRYEGGGSKKECFVGLVMRDVGDSSSGDYTNAPDFAWSDVGTGFCEVELKEGAKSGQLEGRVRAKLVTNSQDNTYTIDNGYIYIVR